HTAAAAGDAGGKSAPRRERSARLAAEAGIHWVDGAERLRGAADVAVVVAGAAVAGARGAAVGPVGERGPVGRFAELFAGLARVGRVAIPLCIIDAADLAAAGAGAGDAELGDVAGGSVGQLAERGGRHRRLAAQAEVAAIDGAGGDALARDGAAGG